MKYLNEAEMKSLKVTNHKDSKFFASILKANIENLYEISSKDNLDVYNKVNNKACSTGTLKYNNDKSKATLIFIDGVLMLRHDEKSNSRFFVNKDDLRFITSNELYTS